MYKQTRTALPFILSGLLFAAIAVVSCNNSEKKTETTETHTTAPPVKDTTMDTGGVKPTPDGN